MRPTGSKIPLDKLKAILVVGTLYSREESYLSARNRLLARFGPLMLESESRPWDYSAHYVTELSPPINRRFLFFSDPIRQDELENIKVATNEFERELSEEGRRTVNVDPGYMTLAKLVLATTKDYSHRIYLGSGIFAEVTLSYVRNEGFKPLPHTYRDYCDAHYLKLFNEVRERARGLLE